MTEQELEDLMRSEAYSNRLHPEYNATQNKVRDGFDNLYPETELKKDRYRWKTVGDGKVRSSHASRDGKIFYWDNPPEGGHPGESPNCRCIAEDVYEKNSTRADAKIKYQIGSLSSKYESKDNPSAIGFDSTGGYSYGTYQIETKKGTMNDFIKFIEKNDRYEDYARQLKASGGITGAAKKTPSFEQSWKNLSKTKDFNLSQKEFMINKKLKPVISATNHITGLNIEGRHPVIKDVLYSTAVQHGQRGASNLIYNALGKNVSTFSDREIIERIYDERSKVDIYFKSSAPYIKESVKNRLEREKQDALNHLNK